MKKIIIILLFPFVGLAQSQDSVMSFVYSNLGKKVGFGICHELIEQAMNQKYRDWNNEIYLNQDSMNFHQIPFDSARAGDVMIMDDLTLRDSSTIEGHIVIITNKSGDVVEYAHQNIGKKGDRTKWVEYNGYKMEVFRKSKVECDSIDVDKIVGGYVYVFRF